MTRRTTTLKRAAALCLSSAAFCSAVYLEDVTAHAAAPNLLQLHPSAETGPAEPWVMGHTAIGVMPAESGPITVAVPDLSGNLKDAQDEARAAGLTLVAYDQYGERVPARYARDYRVRRQFPAPGEHVEPGSRVKLRTQEIFRYARGY